MANLLPFELPFIDDLITGVTDASGEVSQTFEDFLFGSDPIRDAAIKNSGDTITTGRTGIFAKAGGTAADVSGSLVSAPFKALGIDVGGLLKNPLVIGAIVVIGIIILMVFLK